MKDADIRTVMPLCEKIKLVNAHEDDAAEDEINDMVLQVHEVLSGIRRLT